MDANDIVVYQLKASARQVDKVFEGLPQESWGARLWESAMTPGETVAHLTECYIAAQKATVGEKHEWGSYIAPDDDPDSLVETMRHERQKAWRSILKAGNEEAFQHATEYIVLHDAYHVGQIAALRVSTEKDWDPYSIY